MRQCVKKLTGIEIHEGFGMSETPVSICTLYPWTKPVPGAIGFPAPGLKVHILDEDGNHCQRGTIGEICIKSPSPEEHPCGVVASYNFSEEDTADAYRNGFFHTGDLAYRDEQGRFVYFGRNDDVIKSSGYRIGPFEIESVMLEHPSVLEVAVTGVPDAVRGFIVKATVVLRPGFEKFRITLKRIQRLINTPESSNLLILFPRLSAAKSEELKFVRTIQVNKKNTPYRFNRYGDFFIYFYL